MSGAVASLAGACPSLTFTIDGTAAAVNTATSYGGGGSCADLKNGDRRAAVGARNSDGRLVARYVSGAIPTEVTLSGTVAGLAGTCPSLTFTVNGASASTSASTTFSPGGCSDVKNGGPIGLVGTKNADGRVIARAVSVAKTETPPAEVTVTGLVSGLEGTCPSLRFTVDGKRFATSGSTTYGGGACANIANGGKVGVAGTQGSDGIFAARYVSIQ